MKIKTMELLHNEILKCEVIDNDKNNDKRIRQKARLNKRYFEIVGGVLPKTLDITELKYNTYGIITVDCLTRIIQKRGNFKNLYFFVNNSTRYIDKNITGKIVIVMIKGTFEGVIVLNRRDLKDNSNITKDYLIELLECGKAQRYEKLEAVLFE